VAGNRLDGSARLVDHPRAMPVDYDYFIERIEHDATSSGLADVRLAREEFHNLTGKFEEGEPWFELRMNMFHDWYLLDRQGADGLTPAERFIRRQRELIEPAELPQFEHLTVTLRSVFRLIAIKGAQLLLDDLAGGGRWLARWTLPTVGLTLGDIMDSRIVMFGVEPITGRGAVLHPREAHEAVERIVTRARGEGMAAREIVDHLDKMRLKLDRYSNVKIRHVYQYPSDALL
jgi:hypothetical protein